MSIHKDSQTHTAITVRCTYKEELKVENCDGTMLEKKIKDKK